MDEQVKGKRAMHVQKENPASPADRLRQLLENPEIILMAACYDAMSAKLIEAAEFAATFMSGFGVAATRLGMPDTGLISYGELLDQGRNICHAVSIPVLGDGDTGFGNEMNVRRTVEGYCEAGFACVMIEDQVMPKRCGHTAGKAVVERNEALSRIKAAVDARETGADILIMARTDARATLGLEEAIERCQAFVDAGADITFLEAPRTEAEMQAYCDNVSGYKMANLIENGETPLLPIRSLEEMGYKIAVYALTLLNASIGSMQQALACLKRGEPVPGLMNFKTLRQIVGFDDYDEELERYHAKK
jgi:2-methylisocitrate lyase-like PEP mutase family enzyme